MNSKEKEIEQLKAEINYYKKIITWYHNTYENRSIAGVVKEKINKSFKNNFKFAKRKINPPKIDNLKNQPEQTEVIAVDESSLYSSHLMDDKLYKIGVFIHLFYQDLWPEIKSYLDNIGITFDLLITLNQDDLECEQTIKKIKQDFPKAIILKVANRGLDVGPFFELVNYVIEKKIKYDFVLKFHTKKSLGVNADVGEWWRKKSYESLMGSFPIVAHILRLFISQPSIGMIGPYETKTTLTMNDVNHGGNLNAQNITTISKKLNIKDQTLEFFGGTMFWIKWSILEGKFSKKKLSIADFEPGYQADGLLSHAMERLFASLVRDAGFKLYEMNKVNDYLFYKNQRKKICWVHPGFGIGGGNRIIMDICRQQAKYYEVYSVSYVGEPFTNWMDVDHKLILFSNKDEAKHFIETMEIDYVFATGWQTVDFIRELTKPKKKLYFIQDYEPWFADADVTQAKATYSNSFYNIVYSDWLKHKLKKDHNLETYFIKCGTPNYDAGNITLEQKKPTKILLYYKLKNHHGRGADLIEELIKKLIKHPEFEINVVGHQDPQIDGINFHGELSKGRLLEMYAKNDIFIDLSRHRGVATMTMEIAQYGVVSLLSEKEYGLKEYGFIDNVNCLFVDGVNDAYTKTLAISKDENKYYALKKGVIELGKTFDYKLTGNDFNQVVDIV